MSQNLDKLGIKSIADKYDLFFIDIWGVVLANGITDSLRRVLDFAGNLGLGLIQTIFVLSISLMISVHPEAYREILIKLTPSHYRRRAMEILLECGEALSNWMTGVIISSTFA